MYTPQTVDDVQHDIYGLQVTQKNEFLLTYCIQLIAVLLYTARNPSVFCIRFVPCISNVRSFVTVENQTCIHMTSLIENYLTSNILKNWLDVAEHCRILQ
jgi:hypothetical protein